MPGIVRPRPLRYAIGVAMSLLALLLRIAVDPWLPHVSAFMFFVPAVMISAWYGGLGPGLIATAVGTAVGQYFLVRPVGIDFNFDSLTRGGLFLLVGAHISWLSGALHHAKSRAESDAAAAGESEERYRSLAANFPNGAVFLFDTGLRWSLADGAGLAAAGIRGSEFVGRTVAEVLPVELLDLIEPLFRVALAGGSPSREIHYRGHVVLVQVVPLRSTRGEIYAGLSIAVDVTEAAVARDELRRARDELEQRVRERTAELDYRKSLLEAQSEASIDGILVVSHDGRVTYFNRRFVEMWQVPAPAPMASLESVSRTMREKLAAHEDPLVEVEGPYPCPSGEAHQELHLVNGSVFECYSAPVRGGDGTLYGRVWFFHDATARRRAESERDVRLHQQAASSQLGQHALAGRELGELMEEAVTLVARTLGVEYAKVLELLPDGKRLLLRAGVGWADGLVGEATVGAGGDSQAGYTLQTGGPVMVDDLAAEPRFSGPPLLHEHGVRSGMSVVIRDSQVFGVLGAHTAVRRKFTGDDAVFLETVANVLAMAIYRRKAEETRARLAAVVQAAGEAVVGLKLDGTIETWNPAAERIFGHRTGDAIGRPVAMVVPAGHSAEWEQAFDRVRRGDPVENREVVAVRRDGRKIEVGLSVAPIRSPSGEIAGAAAVCLDVTRRKRLEREVLDVCEREQRRMGQDLHDGLGQLLTGIGLMSQALQQRLTETDTRAARDAGEVTALIQQAVAQARDLARGLRPVSLESDALERSLEELALFEQKVTGINCDVRVDQPVEVPNDAVATHLYRIAQEALNNAAKHARPSRVVIRLRRTGNGLSLTVEDDGVGINPSSAGGTGMGLQIMRYRARMIGATLDVGRGPGGGTVVACMVPLPSGERSDYDNPDGASEGTEDEGVDRGRPRHRAAGTHPGD